MGWIVLRSISRNGTACGAAPGDDASLGSGLAGVKVWMRLRGGVQRLCDTVARLRAPVSTMDINLSDSDSALLEWCSRMQARANADQGLFKCDRGGATLARR